MLHHVDLDRLRTAYWAIRPQAAPGVDGVTWAAYGQELEANLQDLHQRVQRGRYQARPSRRAYIPKADGWQRPLGIATVDDRIAQTVAAMYVERQVEPVFHPDSYGYRPGRSTLDAVGKCRERCWQSDWVIDLDIRAFFDSVDHALLLKAVARHTDQKWILLYVPQHVDRAGRLAIGVHVIALGLLLGRLQHIARQLLV